MDVQLQELIDKIKTEGIEQAREKAEQMITEAKNSAADSRREAEAEAKSIVEAAKAKADSELRAGREALAQAGRDLVLGVKKQITELFGRVTEEATADVLKDSVLERAVERAFDHLANEKSPGLQLSEADANALGNQLRHRLANKIAGGVTVSPSARVSAGFRVTVEDGAAYYEFTPTEVARVISSFLSPALAKLVGEARPEPEK